MRYRKTISLALRRANETERFGWWPVKGRYVKVGNFVGFSYRDGPLVFVVHKVTGITVTIGATHDDAVQKLTELIEEFGEAKILAHLHENFQQFNPGVKPKIQLKGKNERTERKQCDERQDPIGEVPAGQPPL